MTASLAGSLVFAGSANYALAADVARELGVELGACTIDRFPDGEVSIRIDTSVRGRDVFVVQPTSPPVNEHLMELLTFADACRRADARRITALVPYFGYARSDKRQGARSPVTARAVADMMQAVGIGRVVTVDAHTPQIEGFFHIPIDDLSAAPPLCAALGCVAQIAPQQPVHIETTVLRQQHAAVEVLRRDHRESLDDRGRREHLRNGALGFQQRGELADGAPQWFLEQHQDSRRVEEWMLGKSDGWPAKKGGALRFELLQRWNRIPFDQRCGTAPGRMVAGLRLAFEE